MRTPEEILREMREYAEHLRHEPIADPLRRWADALEQAQEVPGTATQVEDLHGQIHTLLERGDDLRNDKKELKTEIERLQSVYNAARGLCHGYDWNKGTHARAYRNQLILAVNAIDPIPDVSGKIRPTPAEVEDV